MNAQVDITKPEEPAITNAWPAPVVFPDKHAWRLWAWREFTWRPKYSHKTNGPIIFLPGPDAAPDIDAAQRAGIGKERLIAVDRDQICVDAARTLGLTAICGELNRVLAAWPVDWYLDGILADFYCGLTPDVVTLLQLSAQGDPMESSPIGCSYVINVQRGRDGQCSGHRGHAIAQMICVDVDREMTRAFPHEAPYDLARVQAGLGDGPVFSTYRSRTVVMDGISTRGLGLFHTPPMPPVLPLPRVARCITAARAVTTVKTLRKENR